MAAQNHEAEKLSFVRAESESCFAAPRLTPLAASMAGVYGPNPSFPAQRCFGTSENPDFQAAVSDQAVTRKLRIIRLLSDPVATPTGTGAAARAPSLRFVDANRPSFKVPAIELLDSGFRRFISGHLDKPKPAGTVCLAIHDDLTVLDLAGVREQLAQILIAYSPSQVSYVQSAAHSVLLAWPVH
jgi:hypothetical protein